MKFTWASGISLAVTILTALATAASGAVQSFWTSHSTAGPLVFLLFGAVKLFLPSPINPGPLPDVAKPEL